MAGRPRAFDREQALRSARDAFWERGYEGTSMADLISAMNISSASIYAAFGSKEALFREAVADYDANDGGFASRALTEEPTTRAALRRMLVDAVTLFTRPGKPRGCMVVLSAPRCAKENEGVSDWLSVQRRARHAAIVRRIREARDYGEIKPEADPEVLADFYTTFLQGLSVQARDGFSKKQMMASIDSAMQVFDAVVQHPS
ncbi:TetR family transcriptional regulator [Bradyrhizobium sp. NAS80.1]|uniref:TetR/AcrR family transcriptional regulator n=1 Tax=Bradyrhizobium sp. NAS80.1 TaxID=1680159 RepID=UPI00095FFA3D|nr:TetR/AcrR family transcriptional regulator [Bradyrhizobium sp. NAS80.1]OKO84618.1 TetR family transcriptional regulator [Bradyrhizobium sp. NAS80.1]